MFVFIHQCNAYLEVWEVLFCICKTALAVTVSCLRLHLLPVSSILNAACLCVAVKWGALKSKKEERRKIVWLHITAVCCNSLTLIQSWNDTYAQTRWILFFLIPFFPSDQMVSTTTDCSVLSCYLRCWLASGHLDWRYRCWLLDCQDLLAKCYIHRQCYRLLRSTGGRGSHRHHSHLAGTDKRHELWKFHLIKQRPELDGNIAAITYGNRNVT